MSRPYPKNPRTPPRPLTLQSSDLRSYDDALWRIHTTAGAHPTAWDGLRRYGPLRAFRWEPHPPPRRLHTTPGVSYTATDPTTCFGEVFQPDRAVTLTADRALTGWLPSRPLELLDLTASGWLLRHGASASLPQARRDTCRSWAHEIWEQLGSRIDGLWVASTMTGTPMVVLFPGATSAFPVAPAFSRPLDHSDVATLAVRAAQYLTWPIR